MTTVEKPRVTENLSTPEREVDYRTNLRDTKFNLFEVFKVGDDLGKGPYAAIDQETAEAALDAMHTLATEEIARTYVDGDKNSPIYNPVTREVTTSGIFKTFFKKFKQAKLYETVSLPPHLGGLNAPASLTTGMKEYPLGANASLTFYGLWGEAANVLDKIGNKHQKKLALNMVKNQWSATMVLTEDNAGSDVGAATTKATPRVDGAWNIKGKKRFITGGDHDLSENIIHFVLAKRPDAPAGTEGLSLFVVSKYQLDSETWELKRDAEGNLIHNGVYAAGIEKKAGINGSATCEMHFGQDENDPAIGYLVGDYKEGEHNGWKQMLHIMQDARKMIGIKSMATLSRAYLDALEYAKGRVQGPDMTKMMDSTSPRVEIDKHPGVRRSLAMQRAYAEGLRALAIYAATYEDGMQKAESTGNREEFLRQRAINDLLQPLMKGFGAKRALEQMIEAQQVFGGNGFTKDYPIEQYIRDSLIDPIYEGTKDIQALDLFLRKIFFNEMKGGDARTSVMNEIKDFALNDDGNFVDQRKLLAEGVDHVQAIVEQMKTQASEALEPGKETEIYKVGQNTERLMMAFGDLVVGYLLLRQAKVADQKLLTATGTDVAFYKQKIFTAKFFAREVLPRLSADEQSAQLVDDELMGDVFS